MIKNKTSLNIWIVATETPMLGGGAPIRNFNLIRELARNGVRVTVFCISSPNDSKGLASLGHLRNVVVHQAPLPSDNVLHLIQAFFKRVIPYMHRFRRSSLGGLLEQALSEGAPDIIQIEQINGYYAIETVLPSLREFGTKIVLDAHNVEQRLLSQSIETFPFFKKLIGKYILSNFQQIENRAALMVDAILTCSAEDKIFFEKLGAKKVYEVPNGVDTDYFKPLLPTEEPGILFMGGMTYPPNDDALRWYFNKVYPQIRDSVSSVKMYVIGSAPSSWLKEKAQNDPSIILPGFVPDEREYLAKSRVCISPMRIGSGTGLKILTYMASGRATVATSVGARGIICQDGLNIVIADDPQTFSQGVIRLLNSVDLSMELGGRAREAIVARYSWASIVRELHQTYVSLFTKE